MDKKDKLISGPAMKRLAGLHDKVRQAQEAHRRYVHEHAAQFLKELEQVRAEHGGSKGGSAMLASALEAIGLGGTVRQAGRILHAKTALDEGYLTAAELTAVLEGGVPLFLIGQMLEGQSQPTKERFEAMLRLLVDENGQRRRGGSATFRKRFGK